jgi:hypothetical protein
VISLEANTYGVGVYGEPGICGIPRDELPHDSRLGLTLPKDVSTWACIRQWMVFA